MSDDLDVPGDDGYSGSASLLAGDEVVPVRVTLRGRVDTISGSYHWYGRVAASPAVAELVARIGRAAVTLCTPDGRAETLLADVDPWGRYRVEGRGQAPFHVLTDVPHTAD